MTKPRFWAKTGKGELQENGSPKYHPVICHLADTAAVAMEILRSHLNPIAVQRLSDGLGLSQESMIRFCGFMAGCHDLGKVSPAFQFQVSEVSQALLGKTLYDCWQKVPQIHRDKKTPHGLVTAATLPGFLVSFGIGKALSPEKARKLANELSAIVGGHHGFFPSRPEIRNLDSVLAGLDETSIWRRHSSELFDQLKEYVGLTLQDLPNQCDNAALMLLAGLTTVSDWLASNPEPESGFPYANDMPFEEYKVDLEQKAKNALAEQGWLQTPAGKPLTFTELFGFDPPRDLQQAAIALTKDSEIPLAPPCLILVEASMGEGKTEAALYLADYLQHQTTTGGFYIGLPTQATSNAMFYRVQDFLSKRYQEKVINLTLSHSAAALKEDYQQTICRLEQVFDEGKVVASEWHTARKRTLLSPYGVGTIDQGLMGVVRSRHQFVRLFGLAGRTVILDEVHAYDVYTGTLLERFLEWLALLGSPVIALSATLPKNTRQGLLKAYAQGCGESVTDWQDEPYPRVTAFTNGKVITQSFPASEHVCRALKIGWLSDEALQEFLQDKLQQSGCAAVICSTVGRAQEIYERLSDGFERETELGLFHGRFLFKDRERIEQNCLDKFGKEGNRPHTYVLVATQVIEQSLDVDFDLMISDMAPVDLLLQRSGRLHRHFRENRPPRHGDPELWVIKPLLRAEQKVDFRESGYIYDRHVLLRSWLTLRDRSNVQLPEETDGLIESVYDLHAHLPEDLIPSLQEDWSESLDAYQAKTKNSHWAKANEVKLPPSREKNKLETYTTLRSHEKKEDDESTIQAVTRLGKPSINTIFLQKTTQGLCFPNQKTLHLDLKAQPNLESIRQLLAHSTRISKQEIVKVLQDQKNPPEWRSALLRNCRFIVLDENCKTEVGKWQISLDLFKGVVFSKNE